MALKSGISFDESNFAADSSTDGRIIKAYLKKLSTNVFKFAQKYYDTYQGVAAEGYNYYPLLNNERNLYSIYASAINSLSAIHLSEFGFKKKDVEKLPSNRRVDFWTKYRRGTHGKAINFFIELKCGWYCLNKAGRGFVTKDLEKNLVSLIHQLTTLRATNDNWDDHHDVNIGLMQVQGYYRSLKEYYSINELTEEIHKICDKRTVKNYLVSTNTFSDDLKIQWDKNKCRFISIFSFVVQ
jgi:hypothetical protein